MLPLNEDYSGLYEQLNFIEDYFWHVSKPFDRFRCLNTYRALALVLSSVTGEEFSSKFLDSKHLKSYDRNYLTKLFKKFDTNFVDNRGYHLEMMLQSYFDCSSILTDFCESDYSDQLDSSYISRIDTLRGEDINLVMDFLNQEAKELFPCYEKLVNDGNIYPMPKGDFYDIRGGLTVFNTAENKGNVFLNPFCYSLSDLASFPHELGHILDFSNSLKQSVKDQGLLPYQGVYGEVISSYYEQKFLEYFLEHGNRKEDAHLSLLSYFDQRLQYMWDVSVASMLMPSEISVLFQYPVLLKECQKSLVERNLFTEDVFLSTDNDRLLLLDDSLEYSYGFLLANYFLEHPESYMEFLNVRCGHFDSKKLVSIGITPDEVSKSLVKRSEKIFGKYID